MYYLWKCMSEHKNLPQLAEVEALNKREQRAKGRANESKLKGQAWTVLNRMKIDGLQKRELYAGIGLLGKAGMPTCP
ncbi:hypothetical protein NDU88_003575 [Pleurodeles waltl]|uniref:Uncharacterized protein n=1 Tax=Pleurodeles waltl TaxID=8319 RepID=A0AAV7V0F1_PLEWA|nr:hypothetical protein NDU88_003573 [Pleurodeles waltl]KAJ1194285.1 hypothetical protein NDU88_003574 [Pleurodeles waltl]KAJ1194286.1 hypothetical protein NDU88_003575 [Pleurodeles waltl]